MPGIGRFNWTGPGFLVFCSDIVRGHTTLSRFTNFYVKPEDVGKLTPEDILMILKYTELQDRARQYAKTKREQIGIPQP